MTKKEIVDKLKAAEVEFDASLSAKELHAQFPEILTETAEDDEEADTEESSKTGSITFKVRNPNILVGTGKAAKVLGYALRTFSKEVHGADYKDLAKQFEQSNTHRKIVKPTSKDDAEGKAKFDEDTQYNRNIPHPIIEKMSA